MRGGGQSSHYKQFQLNNDRLNHVSYESHDERIDSGEFLKTNGEYDLQCSLIAPFESHDDLGFVRGPCL